MVSYRGEVVWIKLFFIRCVKNIMGGDDAAETLEEFDGGTDGTEGEVAEIWLGIGLEETLFEADKCYGEFGADGIGTERYSIITIKSTGDIDGDDRGVFLLIVLIDPFNNALEWWARWLVESGAEEGIDDDPWCVVVESHFLKDCVEIGFGLFGVNLIDWKIHGIGDPEMRLQFGGADVRGAFECQRQGDVEAFVVEVSRQGQPVGTVVAFSAEDEDGSIGRGKIFFGFEAEDFLGDTAGGVFHEDQPGDVVFFNCGLIDGLHAFSLECVDWSRCQ